MRFIGHGGSLRPFGFLTLAQADLCFAPRGDAPAAAQILLVFHLRLQIQNASIAVHNIRGMHGAVCVGFVATIAIAQTAAHAQTALFETGRGIQIARIQVDVVGFSTVHQSYAVCFYIKTAAGIAQFGTDGVLLRQRDIGTAA